MKQLSEIHSLLSEYNDECDIKFKFPVSLPNDFQFFFGVLADSLGFLTERLSIQNLKKEQLLQNQKQLKNQRSNIEQSFRIHSMSYTNNESRN